jgi:hypothetical protein
MPARSSIPGVTRMDAAQQIVLASLRQEILQQGAQQLSISLFSIGAALLLAVLCRSATYAGAAPLIPLILISGAFAIGRSDLLMHRAGAYIAHLEAAQSAAATLAGWESFKTSHTATAWLPVYDVFSVLLVFWLFADGQRLAWRALPQTWRLPFATFTTLIFAAALLSVPLAVWLTRSHRT